MRHLVLLVATVALTTTASVSAQTTAAPARRALKASASFASDGRCVFAVEGLDRPLYQGTINLAPVVQREANTVVHQLTCATVDATLTVSLHGQPDPKRLTGSSVPVVRADQIDPRRPELAAVIIVITPQSVAEGRAAIATGGTVTLSPMATIVPFATQHGVAMTVTAQF